MEYPIKYILESVLKKILKDYFDHDNLCIDSVSLFSSTLVLKNLILRTDKINEITRDLGIGIDVITGLIEQITIEGYIFEKKVHIEIDGVNVNLLIPFSKIDKLFQLKKQNSRTPNLNFDSNKINKLFSIIESMKNILLSISNLILNIYVDLEDSLHQFQLRINDVSFLFNQNEEVNCLSRKISMETLSLHTWTIKKSITNKQMIESESHLKDFMKNKIIIYEPIINDFTFYMIISAYEHRFDKADTNFMRSLKSKSSLFYDDIENFGYNSKLDITVKKFETTIINRVLYNVMKIFYTVDKLIKIKQLRLYKSKISLRNAVIKIREKSKSNRKFFSIYEIKNPSDNKFLNIFLYLFLQMVNQKYVSYNFTSYHLMRLLFQLKKLLEQDHLILDDLLQENIEKYLEMPSIADKKSIFMNMDALNKIKYKSLNKSLKDFLFFLMRKFCVLKSLEQDEKSYDDFTMFKFTLQTIKVNIDKSYSSENNYIQENENFLIVNLINLRNKCHLTSLDDKNSFSNKLLTINIEDVGFTLYSNSSVEYLFFKSYIKSIYIWDISYREIDSLSEKYNPILKIEFDIFFNFFKINSNIILAKLDIPTIYICVDPYCLFFVGIYFSKLKNELKHYKYKKDIEYINKEKEFLQNDKYSNQIKGEAITIQSCNLEILRFMIHFNHSKIEIQQTKSIAFNMNKIFFCYNSDKGNIKFNLEEIILGSVENFRIFEFINYKKNILFTSNIVNLIDILQVVDYTTLKMDKCINLKFDEIYVKLNKEDIHIIENYLYTFSNIQKFTPNYKSIFENTLKGTHNKMSTDHLHLESGFLSEASASQVLISEESRHLPEDLIALNNSIRMNKSLKRLENKNDNYENDTKLFLTLSFIKFVIRIKLHNSNDKKNFDHNKNFPNSKKNQKQQQTKHKHLILVFDNLNIYSQIKRKKSFQLILLQNFNLIHRTSKTDRKIIELQSKKYNNIMSLSDIIRHKKNNFSEIDSITVFISSDHENKFIQLKVPGVYIGLDHMLVSYLIQYFDIQNNLFVGEINRESHKILTKLTNKNPYFTCSVRGGNNNNIKEVNGNNDIELKFFIREIILVTFLEDNLFFKFTTGFVEAYYESLNERFELQVDIKYLIDERVISQNNKYILFKLDDTFIKFELVYKMADNTIEIVIENPKVNFLLRQILDIIEYIYFIFFKDILDPFPCDKIFGKTPEELEKIDINEIFKTANGNEFDYFNENPYDSDTIERTISILQVNKNKIRTPNLGFGIKKIRRQGCLRTNNHEYAYENTIVEEKEKVPLKMRLTVKNGEVLICMNSVKKDKLIKQDLENSMKRDKLILAFSEIEYCNYPQNDNNRYLNIIKEKRSKVSVKEKSIELNEIQMCIEITDAHFYTLNTNVITDFGWFNNRDINKTSSSVSFTLLFEMTNEFFSDCKIYLLIPYLKLRLFPDILEKLLRLFFENLMEETTIKSNYSMRSSEYFSKYNIFKPFCDFVILADEININLYNFPSTCLSHRSEAKNSLFSRIYKDHVNFGSCKYAKINPPIELDKFCSLKLTNFYLLFRLFMNGEKNIFIESDSINLELNKYLRVFSKLNSSDLIRSENIPLKKSSSAITNNIKSLNLDIYMRRNYIKEFNINLDSLVLNFVSLAFIAINRFFTKFFFYYQNKNVKNVDHNIIPIKIIQIKLRNTILTLQSLSEEFSNSLHELNINFDFDLFMKTEGSSLGIFTDKKQYGLFIRSIYLNDFKINKYTKNSVNPPTTAAYNNLNYTKNQIVGDANLDIEEFSKSVDKLQTSKRYYYMFGKIKGNDYGLKCQQFAYAGMASYDERNLNNMKDQEYHENVNIELESPFKYKEYINNFTYGEQDFILRDKNIKEIKRDNYRDNYSVYLNTNITVDDVKKNSKIIKISLNISEILKIKKIFDDISKFNNDFYKEVLYPYSDKSSFDIISYATHYGFSINEIELIISDSLFNTKLFKININNLLVFYTTDPEKNIIANQINHLFNKYHIKSADIKNMNQTESKIEEEPEGINFDLLMKFLIRVMYHNNLNSRWEPFIEPLPMMFSYFMIDQQNYMLIDFLSLDQISLGIGNLCRQKNFHSLNLNINEVLLENMRSISNDSTRSQNNNCFIDNQIKTDKKLMIRNLTELDMNILNLKDFDEFVNHDITGEEIEENLVLNYKKDKHINYREILRVSFYNHLSCNPKSKTELNGAETNLENNNNNSPILPFKNLRNVNSVINEENSSLINLKENEISNSYDDFSGKKNELNLEINVEKSSKMFTILKKDNIKLLKEAELVELKKQFDTKISILIEGEQILVSEIDFNTENNTKSVTFRSNEAIKNELDFPVKIKFKLKDGIKSSIANHYERNIILNPRQIYFIPPILIDKIKDIEIKPFFYHCKVILFRSGIYPMDLAAISDDDNNFTVVYCKIKHFDSFNTNQSLYLDSIAFAVIKKFKVVENESIDSSIKERTQWIKSYIKFKGGNYQLENKKRLEKILCDVTYVLSPIVKFYNALPRDIIIKKMLPRDIEFNRNKCYQESIVINEFDIENFIKNYYSRYCVENYFNNIKTKVYCQDNINYISFKDGYKLYNKIHTESPKIDPQLAKITELKIKGNGDYLSIYEPYLFQTKYAKYLQYSISVVRTYEKEPDLNRRKSVNGTFFTRRSTKINNNLKHCSTFSEGSPMSYNQLNQPDFIISPFKFKLILKMMKLIDSKYSNISEYSAHEKYLILNFNSTNIKSEVKNYHCEKNSLCESENLQYTYEITDNNVMTTHLYCPYLFLNSSDLKIVLLNFNQKDQQLPNEKDIDSSEILSRVQMFNTNYKKNFKFYLSTKDIKQRVEVKMLDVASNRESVIELQENRTKNNKPENQISSPKKLKGLHHLDVNILDEPEEDLNFAKNNHSIANPRVLPMNTDKSDKRVRVSIQMEILQNTLKWSKLIFITPACYIFNTTKRDIYIYHFNKNNKGPNKYEVVRAKKTIKFYYLNNFYEFIKISFEDKLSEDDTKLYSGLINFTAGNEFYVTLADKEKEGMKTLLFIKVYKSYNFLYVVMKQKESIRDYPYFIVNNLNHVIKYNQKVFTENKEMKEFFKHSNFQMNIQIQELPGVNSDSSVIFHDNELSDSEIPQNQHYYTWDEPFMRNKNDQNILEIFFFGSCFEVNLDNIHEEIKFNDRIKYAEEKNLYIKDKPIKGIVSVKDGLKKKEYSYSLFEWALNLTDNNKKKHIMFEFHDRDLIFFRKSNGKIILKKNREYEMQCISDEETNQLAGRIYRYIEKARELASSITIKKYVKNKSIYVEITKKNDQKKKLFKFKTMIVCNIQNVSISLIQKNCEFVYIWLKEVSLVLLKSNKRYRKIGLQIKDYQIDHYLDQSHYPIVLAPLSDRSYDINQDYKNIDIEITNMKFSSNFYQVDSVYITLLAIDLRLEYKFIEKLFEFIQTAKNIFSVKDLDGARKDIKKVITEIDECSYFDEKQLMSYENILLIKQIWISDVKISFSMKFDNIDGFLEKTAFLFLKPLIEELGLKILSMDTSMFNFLPFIRNNIYKSSHDFMTIFSTFYYNQFVSELVKSLGGLSSLTNMQIYENLNNNILSNMRLEKNSLAKITKKKLQMRELYKSEFENISLLVGSFFMLLFKMMSVVGKFLAYLTFDETFQQRRLYKLNKSIKSLSRGIILSFKILFFSLIYTLTQFYYVTMRMYGKYRVFGIFLAILIIILGIFLKPVIGVSDMIAKIFESIGFTINDILGDRVQKLARYQRNIKDNELCEYNSIDALAFTVYKYLDTEKMNTSLEDIQLALPGYENGKKVLLLFTTHRIIIVDYDDYVFIPKYQIHFSECKVYNTQTMPKPFSPPHLSIIGKRLGFLTNENGDKFIYIYFDAIRRKYSCKKTKFELVIKIYNFDNTSIISKRYDQIIEKIFNKYH